jgi:hypothetical protein
MGVDHPDQMHASDVPESVEMSVVETVIFRSTSRMMTGDPGIHVPSSEFVIEIQ